MLKTKATSSHKIAVMDGNEACVNTAYRINELCIIYPITPASTMGELADEWSGLEKPNVFGTVPDVVEMHSEGGVAGAMHGALQNGALATTFTASQGLLLMIPDMYRIAGELSPTVFHVATRFLAYQGMSIYCDHSDAMAVRATGFAMLVSSDAQEAHDNALLAQITSLKTRVPFMHFFDGLRTSHEMKKITLLSDDEIRAMLDQKTISEHRARALTPEHPVIRGEVQNSDIVFQGREAASQFYAQVPEVLEQAMNDFAKLTGRKYKPLEYYGAKDAEYVIALMGSGTETVRETVEYLNGHGKKVGLIKVHLFRPFPEKLLAKILPKTVKAIAILDRYKESGSVGEPLFAEISTALIKLNNKNGKIPKVVGGRFGIGSKAFTPSMVRTIFAELKKENPKTNFTIGINDDVCHTSLNYKEDLNIELEDVTGAIFYGLGADGTMGASKNTAKIIGEETDLFIQAYFLYDSKKSGSRTVAHLRFGPRPILSEYLVTKANFIGCHQFNFVTKFNLLENAGPNSIFLLNSFYKPEDVWQHLPKIIQETIIQRKIKFYVIDAYRVAEQSGLGGRINNIMQTCFFALSGVLPKETALTKIKAAVEKTYSKKGADVVAKNLQAIDNTLANLHEVKVPSKATSTISFPRYVPEDASQFHCEITETMIQGQGNNLPVSKVPCDGTYQLESTKYEKRNTSLYTVLWDQDACIQCGQCTMVCPHSAIRAKHYDKKLLKDAPKCFQSVTSKDKNFNNHNFTIQIYPEDCTGCGVCVKACPVKKKIGEQTKKAINLALKTPEIIEKERDNIEFFNSIPEADRANSETSLNVRDVQYLSPMFEFSGACAGCGEAPYVRLLTQLFGDRLLIANACGCSSVYCGNLPTSPFSKDKDGKGPAWNSSLFEDNAEFGFGMALSATKLYEHALELLDKLKDNFDEQLVTTLIQNPQNDYITVHKQRELVKQLKPKLEKLKVPEAEQLLALADHLVKPCVWAYGGDGWAYDIGFGGLDHVIASGKKINLLVMDTEVYSNTGGQASKATPRGSVAKFAAQGKRTAKKELGLMAMTYGNVYVAHVAMGANPNQTIKALQEAESYPGASLVIAYSPCIAHGYEMKNHLEQQKLAVKSGYWPLYRYDPRRKEQGLNPFQMDSAPPSMPLEDYMYNENRFRILKTKNPEAAKMLLEEAKQDVARIWEWYSMLLGVRGKG